MEAWIWSLVEERVLRLGTRASSSSKKMIEGAEAAACGSRE
jgi:hypothetical protein